MANDETRPDRWAESDSEEFLDHGRYFVPDRERQAKLVAELLGEVPDGAWVVDLCCGEGLLLEAALDRCPGARGLGLDGSATMLDRAAGRLARFGERVELRRFDLASLAPGDLPKPLAAAVSSLAVHHLEATGKRELFAKLHGALDDAGALVIADLVLPAGPAGRELAAGEWDRAVRDRAIALDGDLGAFDRFVKIGWNSFRQTEPDPVDHPDRLRDQLRWLEEAGFREVDVYWMRAGHAIFGGVR